MVKTASYTAAVKTLPTKYITRSVTTDKSSPTVSPSEVTITIPFSNSRKFLPVTTTLPDNVDEIYATCINRNNWDYEKERKLLDLPYACYKDECYHEFNNVFVRTYGDQNAQTTLDCKIYTSKENDPTPTESINDLTTPVCIPTVSTSELNLFVSSKSTEITNETDSNQFTVYRTSVFSNFISTYSQYTICKTKTKSPANPTSIASTPVTLVRTYETPLNTVLNTEIVAPRTVLDYSVPKSIKEIALKCKGTTRYSKYNPFYNMTKTLPITGLPKTISSSAYSKTIKTITATKSIPMTAMSVDSSSSSSSSSNSTNKIERRDYNSSNTNDIIYYCENESSCWRYYTIIDYYRTPNVYTTIQKTCTIYTPEPTPSLTSNIVVFTTSLCKPTVTFEIEDYKNFITKEYSSTIYDGPEKTYIDVKYGTRAPYKIYSRNDCFYTTSTPTPTPTPSITTKCIPNIMTVTEKEKVTVTEKKKVTVTVEVYE